MSQPDTDKAVAAQGRSQETESFVRTVKTATRRKYTPEEKIRIVLEGFRRDATVSDLCRREGTRPHSYYSWIKEFMEADKERPTRDNVQDATRQEIQQRPSRCLSSFRALASSSDEWSREGGGGDKGERRAGRAPNPIVRAASASFAHRPHPICGGPPYLQGSLAQLRASERLAVTPHTATVVSSGDTRARLWAAGGSRRGGGV